MAFRTTIFLASSADLKAERGALRARISQRNQQWHDAGIFLDLQGWEDQIDAMSRTRKQDDYNNAIRAADIFVLLVDTKLGKYTAEEFDAALTQFKATGRPLIYTYLKNRSAGRGGDLGPEYDTVRALQTRLATLGHFSNSYESVEGLIEHFSQQLEKLKDTGLIVPATREFAPLGAATGPSTLDKWALKLVVGRETELAAIRSAFTKRDAGNQRISVVLLHGFGGLGKTTLAVEYGRRYAREYSATLIVGASEHGSIDQELVVVAERLGIAMNHVQEGRVQATRRAVANWLRDHPNWLLIVDGADDRDTYEPELQKLLALANTATGHVLVTSRRHDWRRAVHLKIQVGPLPDDIVGQMLVDHVPPGSRGSTTAEDTTSLHSLIRELAGVALAVDLACSYLEVNNGVTLTKYLLSWKAKSAEALDWSDPDLQTDDGTVRGSIPSPLPATLQTTLARLRPTARTLLRLLSFFAPVPIPHALLDTERASSHFATAAANDPFEEACPAEVPNLKSALEELIRYSLVQRSNEADGNVDGYVLHKIVRDVTQYMLRREVPRRRFWNAYPFLATMAASDEARASGFGVLSLWTHPVKLLAEYLKLRGDDAWSHVYAHALAATQVEELAPEGDLVVAGEILSEADLLFVATSFYLYGEYEKAISLLSTRAELGSNFERAQRLRIVSDCRTSQGRVVQARKAAEQALSLLAPDGGGHELLRAQLLEALGWCARLIGNCREALDCFARAGALYASTGTMSWRASALLGEGGSLDYLGRTAEAMDCFNESLLVSREVGDPHAECGALYFRGFLKVLSGDVSGAVTDLKAALSEGNEYLFDDVIAEANWILGLAYCAVGDFTTALGCLEVTMNSHYELTRPCAMLIAGGARLRLGEESAARKLFAESVVECERALEEGENSDMMHTKALALAGLTACREPGAEQQSIDWFRKGWDATDAHGTDRYLKSVLDIIDPECRLGAIRASARPTVTPATPSVAR